MTSIKKTESLKILSSPKSKNTISVIACVDDVEVDDETPLRPIFCLKRKSIIKDFDDKEDCFILDFNPEENLLGLSDIKKNNRQEYYSRSYGSGYNRGNSVDFLRKANDLAAAATVGNYMSYMDQDILHGKALTWIGVKRPMEVLQNEGAGGLQRLTPFKTSVCKDIP